MKFPAHDVKIPTNVGRKSSILGLSEAEKKRNFVDIYTYEHLEFYGKCCITSGPDLDLQL